MSGTAQSLKRRSAFISIMAWLGILSGGFGVLAFVVFLVVQPAFTSAVGFLSSGAALVTALGLRARREWARQGFIAFLAYSSLMAIVGALRWHVPQLTDFKVPPGTAAPAITQAQLDALAASARGPLLVMAGIGTVINLLIILKLRSRRVREEFDESAV
jgi:hypothetical protein